MRTYKLFTTGPGGRITNKTVDYAKGGFPWIVEVRAESLRDAHRLLSAQTPARDLKSKGIVSIDRSAGPGQWPWDIDQDAFAGWRR